MEAVLVSTLVVAIGEIGDKTQLLAFLLSARFRRPVPIILGILCATLLNHALAGLLGGWIRAEIPEEVLRWVIGGSFLGIALWVLKPDTLESDSAVAGGHGAFAVTAITFAAFFVAEIGDKTQIATVVLAAHYDSLVAVVAGTTAGMLLADVPAVLLAERAGNRIPLKLIRYIAAAAFAAMGITVLTGFKLT